MVNTFNRNDGTFAQVDFASLSGAPATSTTTNPQITSLTNATTVDLAMVASTTTFTTGPGITQGSSGTWFVTGVLSFFNSATAAVCGAKMWDGTTVLSEGIGRIASAGVGASITLNGIITSPSSNLKVLGTSNSTGTVLAFSPFGNNVGCTITAIRIG